MSHIYHLSNTLLRQNPKAIHPQVKILDRHVNPSAEEIEKDISRPKYFDPYSAKEYGIIDKVESGLYSYQQDCTLNIVYQ